MGAKLFGIAAVAVAVIALVPVKLTDAMFGLDFYLHDTYFVVPPRYGIGGFALLCGVSAGFYYFGDRASGHRLNEVQIKRTFCSLDSPLPSLRSSLAGLFS